VLEAGIPPARWTTLSLDQLDLLRVRGEPAEPGYRLFAADHDITDLIRSTSVNANVSAMAALPAVRTWLLERLRSAGRGVDLVADGRDMGTVVFPDAELKFFLLAETAVRAQRRLLERSEDPAAPGLLEREAARIEARDLADSTRAVAPLRRPEGAIVIDTTDLSFEQRVSTIVGRVRSTSRHAPSRRVASRAGRCCGSGTPPRLRPRRRVASRPGLAARPRRG
jgi:cytidylate kinase